jgi:hypothetical protein
MIAPLYPLGCQSRSGLFQNGSLRQGVFQVPPYVWKQML